MLVPKYNRFRRRDDWDDDDEERPRRSPVLALAIACAPVLLDHYLEHRAEQRRRLDAIENPELYDVEDEE